MSEQAKEPLSMDPIGFMRFKNDKPDWADDCVASTKAFLFDTEAVYLEPDGYSAKAIHTGEQLAQALKERDELLAALKLLREDAYNAYADSNCDHAFKVAEAVITKIEGKAPEPLGQPWGQVADNAGG